MERKQEQLGATIGFDAKIERGVADRPTKAAGDSQLGSATPLQVRAQAPRHLRTRAVPLTLAPLPVTRCAADMR